MRLKCDLAGRLVQCCTCSKWVHLKCSVLSTFRTLGSSHSWSCPLLIQEIPHLPTLSSSDSSTLCNSTVQSGPHLLMQHFRPTLVFKPIICRPLPTLSCTLTTALCSWLLLYISYILFSPNSLRVLQWNACVSEPGALNCYPFFRLIPLTLSLSRNLTLIHLSISGSLDFLLCDLIAPTPGLALFLLMPLTLAASSSSFSSGRAYPSPELSISSLHLTPSLIM